MLEIVQIIIILFGFFAFSRVFINIQNRTLNRLESIFWLLFWALVIVITLFPDLISWLSIFVGVGRPIDLVIYLSLILLAYLIFRLYAKLTNVERNITKIVRRIALDKKNKK